MRFFIYVCLLYNLVDNKLIDILMSFFNKILKSVYEKVVQDEFSQPLTEQQIYHIIHKNPCQTSSTLIINPHDQQPKEYILTVIKAITQQTAQIQFRKLGNQPHIQKINARLSVLKQKLGLVDKYMIQHYQQYLKNINLSLNQYDQTKEIFITRKKSIQLKFILEKMTKMLVKGKIISKLNIKLNNIKNVIKIIQKIPNIKKMNLIQLKTINLSKLQQISLQIIKIHSSKLNCLQNLSKYISKVNNQSFVYIINNLKSTIDNYDIIVYEDIIKSYLIIQPNTPLQKLMFSLIQEKVRDIFYHHSSNVQELIKIGHKISNLMMNIHQIIKWHILHKAIQSKHLSKPHNKLTQNQQSPQRHDSSIQTRDRSISLDSNEIRPRQLSFDSNNSQQGVNSIQLSQIVFIDLLTLKTRFNDIIDNSLCQFAQENITSQLLQPKYLYQYLNVLSKLCELCNNFTGLDTPKIKRLINQYYIKKQLLLYNKLSKDLFDILQEQRTNNHWNRCAYPNNFKFRPIDKMLYKLKKYQESQEFVKIRLNIYRFFGRDKEIRYQQDYNQEGLEMVVAKVPEVDRGQKNYEEIYSKEYLNLNDGDAILSHSSIKTLSLFEKYVQFIMYTPLSNQYHTYFHHLAVFIEYYIYYIFHTLLSPKYRNIFYQIYDHSMPIDKKYTLKRMYYFYPTLTIFLSKYKAIVAELNQNTPKSKIYNILKKQIKDHSNGEQKQILRAKVIASEACKYLLAYYNQIYKHNQSQFIKLSQIETEVSTLKLILSQLSNILLSQSCQGMLGKQLQTIRGLFQSIRWHEPYQQLKEYVNKIISIIRQSYQKLKSSHKGEIPLAIIHRIFVLIWRTIMTYGVKLFLQNKSNNRKECKLNFEKYIDELYSEFQKNQTSDLQSYNQAYQIFKSIFPILLNNDEEQTRKLIRITIKKYDYIYPILINIVENIEIMNHLNQRQKEMLRNQIKEEVQIFLKQKK